MASAPHTAETHAVCFLASIGRTPSAIEKATPMTELDPSTLRILNVKGQTIGTGFLVAKTLAVTCAHVAMAAAPDGDTTSRCSLPGAAKGSKR